MSGKRMRLETPEAMALLLLGGNTGDRINDAQRAGVRVVVADAIRADRAYAAELCDQQAAVAEGKASDPGEEAADFRRGEVFALRGVADMLRGAS